MGKERIPVHLREILSDAGTSPIGNWIRGECRCSCGCGRFCVHVFAETNAQRYPVIGSYQNGFALKILAVCADCGKRTLLFDAAVHGYSGAVLGEFLTVPDTLTDIWHCPDCGKEVFGAVIHIQPGDYGQYRQETDAPEPLTEEAFTEAFDWIRMDLTCVHCGKKAEEWVSLETS